MSHKNLSYEFASYIILAVRSTLLIYPPEGKEGQIEREKKKQTTKVKVQELFGFRTEFIVMRSFADKKKTSS